MSSCGRSVEIRVCNLQRSVPINAAALEKFASKALPLCLALHKTKTTDLTKLREISVLIVSNRRITSLHRQFLNESGPTDVITFSHGEIFIGAGTAQRHAHEFGNPLKRELRLYVIHGLLHLHGFDDSDKVAARKMEKAQERILKRAEM
jgi:probable rRNA maturation factor